MYTYEIDFRHVVRDDRVAGNIPAEMNTAIGWAVGTLLIQITRATGAVVATDDHPTSAECAERFTHGVTNSGHYKATASRAGTGSLDYLRYCCRTLAVPGCHIETTGGAGSNGDAEVTTLRLYDAVGEPITKANGMSKIRERLIADQIPRPVSVLYRGEIVERPDLAEGHAGQPGDPS